MGGMIAHAELAFDDQCDAFGGPDLASEPIGLGSFGQQGGQLRTLLRRQLGRRTWRRVMAQGFWPLGFPTAYPLTDRSFGDSQRFRNLALGPSLFVQFPGA